MISTKYIFSLETSGFSNDIKIAAFIFIDIAFPCSSLIIFFKKQTFIVFICAGFSNLQHAQIT
ncbi:hypothetical protein BpHYR1_044877 [Brachionus plicatilis]|uniref:Uncharacterized protein n=1 Tax=Brachionus plicatilis TaxID=10195 RepID=A0A3M7R2H2_BRAPC|nr:hypothetical protein BpHYR1_044877 [Brachionus plicatilis]